MRYSEKVKIIPFTLLIVLVSSLLYGDDKEELYFQKPWMEGKRFVTHKMEEVYRESIESFTTCGSVLLSYPEYVVDTSASINDSLKFFICQLLLRNNPESSIPEAFDRMADGTIKSFKQIIRDAGLRFIGANKDFNVRVVTDLSNILGVESDEWGYTGGAHPYSMVTYGNFELNSGRRITLENILVDEYKSTLDSIGETKFRKLKKISPTDDLSRKWNFKDDKFALNTNFMIHPSGLIFYFNEYEISGYAQGPTSLTIDFDSISKLIRPDGPLPAFIEALKKTKP